MAYDLTIPGEFHPADYGWVEKDVFEPPGSKPAWQTIWLRWQIPYLYADSLTSIIIDCVSCPGGHRTLWQLIFGGVEPKEVTASQLIEMIKAT